MKFFIHSKRYFLLPAFFLLAFSPKFSFAQSFFGVSSSPADGGSNAGPNVTVTPPAGMQVGDLVIIYSEYRATGATFTTPTTGGQTWSTATTYSPGGTNQSIAVLWCTFNGTWAANPVVSAGAGNTNGLTAVMYVFRPNSSNDVWSLNTVGTNANSNTNPSTITGVTTTAPYTVAMSFWSVAATNTWSTLTGAGWSQTGLSTQYRNTTTGQSHSSAYFIQTSAGATGNVTQTESAATTALKSIVSWSAAPPNDLCANAVTLTNSGSTCTSATGSVVDATYTGPLTDCFGATPTYDVWYKFVAQTTNPTISVNIGATGSNINLGKMQMFSGACGALVAMAPCATYDVTLNNPGTTSINTSGLTIGNTYYVRIYSSNAIPTTNGTFSICVTDPAPVNDDCGSAVTLTPGATCVTTAGNTVGATLSSGAPLPTCGTPVYDVWYSFIAASSVQTITLSSPGATGANFINPGIQLLSGACGSLTTVACNSGLTLTAPSLTIGQTYYVRVYSTSAVPTSNGVFNICVVNAPGNDECIGAISLTSSTTCTTTAGSVVNATLSLGIPAPSCGTPTYDVWYSFTAYTTNPKITLSGLGANFTNQHIQLLSGSCGSLTQVGCVNGSSLTAAGLTIGNTYYVRVFSTTVGLAPTTNGGFNICVQDPAPANDLCSGAITLTSSTSCVNTPGTVYGSTNTAITITGDCAGAVTYDVWYKFVAQTPNPTITLSSIGSAITNPGMELLDNKCGSTFTAQYCGTTSIAANYLTPGSTYYIRVYSSGTAPASPTNAGFNICVVDPVATPPFNDDCANAINIPIWNTCNNVNGNIAGATLSSGLSLSGACTGTVAYDVWFKFTAVNSTATISLSTLGTNFSSASPGLQIFSGTCGALTAIACANSTTVSAAALTAGSVYYVRVFSTAAGPAPNGNARFNICATTTNAPVRFGNSYVNISRKTTGGVIQPGDTLEIRFTVNHTSGTMTKLRYVDDLPTHTNMLTGTNDSIRIITNEGLTYKKYTLAADGDAATYKASPGVGEYNIRLNLGFASGAAPGAPVNNTNTATSANGQMNAATDNPRGGGGLLFAIAYRVVVTGAVGDTVSLFPGQFIYNDGTSDIPLTATPFNILVSNPLALCSNSIGLNNAVENGGTFGSGTTLNRSTDLTTPIAGYTFVPDVSPFNVVGDGRYAIIKNNSPTSSSFAAAGRQPTCPSVGLFDPLSCYNRMFNGFWYIAGDHSGTNNAVGNPPPDASTPSGYMLEVNADYVASEVYRQTLTNLCPNTYYEFSAWVKNICPNCGIDSLGKQFSASAIPADKNGYPGVLPNLTFALDGLDYYNTGEIDTLGWLKKGFVFKTAAAQTTATFSIRNNAQGGGGNDWALDDIAIATCLPTMSYSPTINPVACQGNPLDIRDTVTSFFNNYTDFKWQRSTDAGNTWSDITSAVDTTLTQIGSTYQFITKYTIPPTLTTPANNNDLYRVIVATSSSNLANSACLYTDASTIITLSVINCGPPLSVDLLSFSGKLNANKNAELLWVTSKEDEPVSYSVEKSLNGTSFNSIAMINGHGSNNETNYYQFTDPSIVTGKVWYRIAIVNKDGNKKYSRVILLEDKTNEFGFTNVVNPFNNEIDFEISVPQNSRVEATLINLSGNIIKRFDYNVYAGSNNLTIPDTGNLPAGMYILQVSDAEQVIRKKLIKK